MVGRLHPSGARVVAVFELGQWMSFWPTWFGVPVGIVMALSGAGVVYYGLTSRNRWNCALFTPGAVAMLAPIVAAWHTTARAVAPLSLGTMLIVFLVFSFIATRRVASRCIARTWRRYRRRIARRMVSAEMPTDTFTR